ncbi:kappa-type opioid receptor-like [Acanthaster planci]|uniref:Kappa-type opioid receptor-like n=1 Tax=Acanthaster planci TaxID=133434 RepID=A0A8B7XZV8_ACAPL|nr:kappa-type opioid receptor-like [Acanthaster planci]
MNQTAGHDLLESTSASTESDECGLVYSVTDIIVASVIGVIVALIIILNTLCLWVLRRVKNINDTSKVFLYSLTFSDLMVGIFPGIPTVVLLASKSWPFGEFLCTVHAMFGHYTHGTSIYSLLLLTVDRYISVVFSLRYPSLVTVVRARITVCSIWIIFFLVLTVYGFVAEWDYRIVDPILKCGWSVRHGEQGIPTRGTSNDYPLLTHCKSS